MNAIQNICPNFISHCVRVIMVYLSKKLGKKKKSYDGLHQFEEQQFSIHSFPKDNEGEETLIRNSHAIQSQMFQEQETTSSEYQQVLHQLDKLVLKLNLEPYDRYYLLLQAKIKNASEIFYNPSQSQIYLEECQTAKSMFKISQIPTSAGFKFIYSVVLPCSYAFYNQTIYESKTNPELNKHIKKYLRHQSVYSNLSVMGMEFKKVLGLGLQPRNFTYIKYQNSPENGYFFELCASVNNQYDGAEEAKAYKQGEVYSISKIKQQNDTIYMKVYLQIDLKSIIRAHKIVRKGIKELLQYYQRLYQFILENYQKEVV